MLKIVYRLLWLVGALILIYFGNEIFEHADQVLHRTFNIKYPIQATCLISVISGIYLGLIRGIPAKFRVNAGHLLVFVITLLFVLYYALGVDLGLRFPRLLLDLYRFHGLFLIGIICGLSLCMGLVGVKKED